MTTNRRRQNWRDRNRIEAALKVARVDLPMAARLLAWHHIPYDVARRVLLTPRRSA